MAKIAEKVAAAEEQGAPATITIPLQDAEALYQMLHNSIFIPVRRRISGSTFRPPSTRRMWPMRMKP